MSELLRDVDEMVRQERLMQIWRQYGNQMIGGFLAVLLTIGLYQGYGVWRDARNQAATAAIQSALTSDKPVDALAQYAAKTGGNSAAVARLIAAAKALAAKNDDEARALLLATRNDSSAAVDLRDLATLIWVRLNADTDMDADALLNALKPLMRTDSLPWSWQARLEAAVITANRKNDPAAALELLKPMRGNAGLPYTQSERAEALAQVYSLRAEKQVKTDAK